MSAEHG